MNPTRIVSVSTERVARRHLDRAVDQARRAANAAVAGDDENRKNHLLHAAVAAEDAARVLREGAMASDTLQELAEVLGERNELLRRRGGVR